MTGKIHPFLTSMLILALLMALMPAKMATAAAPSELFFFGIYRRLQQQQGA
jgi:hypothetical protein